MGLFDFFKNGSSKRQPTNDVSSTQNSAKLVGVVHSQEEFDKFMLEITKKLFSEGYQHVEPNYGNMGKKAGDLYSEGFSKLGITMNKDEIYEYSQDPYKLLISRGELGLMMAFVKK
jgi:hypothetical protein